MVTWRKRARPLLPSSGNLQKAFEHVDANAVDHGTSALVTREVSLWCVSSLPTPHHFGCSFFVLSGVLRSCFPLNALADFLELVTTTKKRFQFHKSEHSVGHEGRQGRFWVSAELGSRLHVQNYLWDASACLSRRATSEELELPANRTECC